MHTLLPALTLVAAGFAGSALAQAPGPNGGQTVIADGHPIELVISGTQLTFFVTDDDGKPMNTAGLKAKAFIQAGGKTTTVTLVPEASNKLIGALAAPLDKGAKVVLSGKLHGHNLQARFAK